MKTKSLIPIVFLFLTGIFFVQAEPANRFLDQAEKDVSEFNARDYSDKELQSLFHVLMPGWRDSGGLKTVNRKTQLFFKLFFQIPESRRIGFSGFFDKFPSEEFTKIVEKNAGKFSEGERFSIILSLREIVDGRYIFDDSERKRIATAFRPHCDEMHNILLNNMLSNE